MNNHEWPERNAMQDDYDDGLDELIELIKAIPEQTKLLDHTRYATMMTCAALLKSLLTEFGQAPNIQTKLDPFYGMGAITTELMDLSVDDTVTLSRIMASSSNVEITPLTNGNIRLSLTFNGMFHSIG